ncbi:MAG: Peptidoglycan-binding domain 1 protein [Actinomycetia bacterium]|nr:Peptidoglycan-binding domain 1 protein [Actinomycetes bacterium]
MTGRAGGWSRRRLTVAGVTVVVLAAGAITTARSTSGSGSRRAASSTATTTATVQLTDLAETTPVSGTVGFASRYTIVQPAGTGPQDVTQAHQAVALAGLGLSQAQAMLASDTALLRTDQATLAAARQKQANDCQGDAAADSSSSGSTPCASDTAEVASAQKAVDADQQKVTADQDEVAAAQLALANAQTARATAGTAATAYHPTSKYTALPRVGQVVLPGQSLWSVDGRPVPLLPGSVTAWRAFVPGMPPGADVAALHRALVQLGFGNGLRAADAFSAATAAAIRRLQTSLGVPRTGTLPLGSVVFGPTAVRVTTVHPLVGNTVVGDQPVLDVTSTTPVVNVALPVGQTSRVKVGDPVTVNLPDGTTGEGTITAVGTVATNTTPSDSGNDNTSATVDVAVSLTKASPAGALDQAPVTVNITNDSAQQVLAVPTTALLALAGGGYAVEVVEPGGTHELVAVTTGIFDDQSGLVQVDGAALAAGQRVVVAS